MISIVMGSYNQKAVLEKVIPRYANQTLSKDEFEVIVVDSSSTDGSSEWLTSYDAPFNFRPLIRPNAGKAAARNYGVSQAKGDWIIITDADMIPDPEFAAAHQTAHRKADLPTCFEGLAWNMDTLSWPPSQNQLHPQVGTHPRHLGRLGWYYFLTGNLSFPKQLFEKFEGFDTKFIGYGWEDLELGYRLSRAKIPLLYLRTAVNYHYHLISPEEDLPRCKDKGRSAKYMLSKHPELKWFMGLNPLSVFVFKRLYPQGKVYHNIRAAWEKTTVPTFRSLGLWFLKEYHYLEGLLT